MHDHGFRFQQFDIWQRAIALESELHDIADGSGSDSDKEFSNYLNIAHHSAFETANIVPFLHSRSLLATAQKDHRPSELEQESRMLTAFRRSLKSPRP